MSNLVILTLIDNNSKTTIDVKVEIRTTTKELIGRAIGKLPSDLSSLLKTYQDWQTTLRSLAVAKTRIKIKKISTTNTIEKFQKKRQEQWYKNCKNSELKLKKEINNWLESEQFYPIKVQLDKIPKQESTLVLICNANSDIKKLPWTLWKWLEDRKAEIVFSPIEYNYFKPPSNLTAKILVVLGDSEGINTGRDLDILIQKLGQKLSNSLTSKIKKYILKIWLFLSDRTEIKIETLINPSRQELNQYLWDFNYDILFFAGHSETENNIGKIYLNKTDTLEIQDLKFALQEALSKDLKLAVFNSCDGLGLAYQLQDLNIPNLIVMRDIISDEVAQQFLSDLIQEFVINKKSLHLAEQEARRKLQGLEDVFPCASWMPVLFQRSEEPQFWHNWMKKKQNLRLGFGKVVLMSIMITGLVMIARSLGFLQLFELQAYDRLMRQRHIPSELIDERILVVEITDEDTDEYGYPITDATLAKAIEKVYQYHPKLVGVDIHRGKVQPPGREALLKHFFDKDSLFIVCAYDADSNYAPPKELIPEQEKQLGFSNLIVEGSQGHRSNVLEEKQQKFQRRFVRRQHLSYNPNLSASTSECPAGRSLSLQMVIQLLSKTKSNIDISLTNSSKNQWKFGETIFQMSLTKSGKNKKEWKFGETIFQRLPPTKFGGYQSLDKSHQIMINYRTEKPGLNTTLRKVLENKVDSQLVRDKIILIGYTSETGNDYFETPYGTRAGVWIHAHMISQILSTILDKRSQIWVLPQWGLFQWGDTIWILIWSIFGGFVAWILSRQWLYVWLTIFVGILGLYQICIFALMQGLWLPIIPSLLSFMLTAILLEIAYFKSDRNSNQEDKSP